MWRLWSALVVSACAVSGFVRPGGRFSTQPAFVLAAAAADDNDHDASSSNKTLVTKEMFLRDLLQDPVVKRKKIGRRSLSDYKVLDNRDSLPFAVQLTTPDPYTHPQVKQKQARKVKKRADAIEERIASKLYAGNDSTVSTLLGEFQLDKHTTNGDILQIGNVEYKVVKHRCQYKYAGGQRFVMVRKILHVKEVGRWQTEEQLARQWQQSVEEKGPE